MHMDEPLPQADQNSDDNGWVPHHLRHNHFTVAADPKNPQLLFDAQLMPRLSQPSQTVPHHIAIISQITVSRKGGFSCPVRTGAILACVHMNQPCTPGVLGDGLSASGPLDAVPAADPSIVSDGTVCATSSKGRPPTSQQMTDGPDDEALECSHVRDSLARLTSSFALQLRQCRSFDALQDTVAQKLLPPVSQICVHRGRSHFCGVTVEFEVPRGDDVQVCCRSCRIICDCSLLV